VNDDVRSGTMGTVRIASRRRALLAALGAAGMATLTTTSAAFGQDATPDTGETVSWLIVQPCDSGRAEPIAGNPGTYTLTLAQPSGITVYFSDRPARLAGLVTTASLLAESTLFADSPPNAALAFQGDDDDGTMRIAAVELTSGSLAPETRTVIYQATVLPIAGDSLSDAGDLVGAVDRLPEVFGRAWLFIDGISGPGRSTHFPVDPGSYRVNPGSYPISRRN
jgi:hypothetical protein